MSHDIFKRFEKYEPINKGWSEDKKYRIETSAGQRMLLRVSDIAEYERKKALHEMMERVAKLDIPMCLPLEFGTCDGFVYSLQSWIDGEDLKTVLPRLTEAEQYALGLKAGEILRKIHGIPVSEACIEYWTAMPLKEDWATRFNRELDNAVRAYKASSLRFVGDAYVLDYIEKNRVLLNGRPRCLDFDDYNAMNMMYANGGVMIIDFERYNIGDPWEAFSDIVWSVKYSHHFATGQIRAYFGGKPPEEFFKLLALYFANYLLAFWKSHPITTEFGRDVTLGLSKNVMEWFDNMNNPVPTWYLRDFHVQYIDGIPCKLKEPFDFSFLGKYGKVFKVFDEQASGCICFGVVDGEKKYFIKFAGVRTINNHDLPVSDAVARLKAAAPKYTELAHPLLINLLEAKSIGNGYMLVFGWEDGES